MYSTGLRGLAFSRRVHARAVPCCTRVYELRRWALRACCPPSLFLSAASPAGDPPMAWLAANLLIIVRSHPPLPPNPPVTVVPAASCWATRLQCLQWSGSIPSCLGSVRFRHSFYAAVRCSGGLRATRSSTPSTNVFIVAPLPFPLHRLVPKERQDPLLGPGQCGQDDVDAHADT